MDDGYTCVPPGVADSSAADADADVVSPASSSRSAADTFRSRSTLGSPKAGAHAALLFRAGDALS